MGVILSKAIECIGICDEVMGHYKIFGNKILYVYFNFFAKNSNPAPAKVVAANPQLRHRERVCYRDRAIEADFRTIGKHHFQ